MLLGCSSGAARLLDRFWRPAVFEVRRNGLSGAGSFSASGGAAREPGISTGNCCGSRAFGERAGVRGNGAAGLTRPPKTSLARGNPSLKS